MHILIIGGTIFVGRHLTQQLLEAGHQVTLLHRGQNGKDLFPEVEHIFADRDGGLDVLKGRKFDRVIDTCGYVPRIVDASAHLLSSLCDHYTFISTISVYGIDVAAPYDESAPLAELAEPTTETVDAETYGGLKVLCEKAVQNHYPTEGAGPRRGLIIRPGLIVGPFDKTDRFTYWPMRIDGGGEVLAPGIPTEPVQFVDVRDLAAFTVKLCLEGQGGVYNLTGPEKPLSMADFLGACIDTLGADATLKWASEGFLKENEVQAYSDLPLWVPSEYPGFGRVSSQAAIDQGLNYRPLAETIKDTVDWFKSTQDGRALRAGLKAEREAALLAAI